MRMSKTHQNQGSLRKGDVFRIAYFVWDGGEKAFYVHDRVAKKKYGPFASVPRANESGQVEFYADGGRRAEKSAPAAFAVVNDEIPTVA